MKQVFLWTRKLFCDPDDESRQVGPFFGTAQTRASAAIRMRLDNAALPGSEDGSACLRERPAPTAQGS